MQPLRLSVITLPFDPALQGFDDSRLRDALGDDEIVEVVEHLITFDNRPWWALLITHRSTGDGCEPRAGGSLRSRTSSHSGAGGRRDWAADLPSEAKVLYNMLRKWRTQAAREQGVPSYVLFTNQQLATIARAQPDSLQGLHRIEGVGDARVSRHGEAVLRIIASQRDLESTHETGTDSQEIEQGG